MMNRSTQKELIKLLLQLNEMWPQMELQDKEQQIMVLDILNTVTSKCQQDFSKEKNAEYTDTLQALGQVIQSTDWQHTSKEELAQCIGLCQEIILQLTNNLRQEKEIKKDIVFLPYKASMWDSLESVWQAAYEDKEHCNTYVVPIPYCDRNPDGSPAQWHCEIGEFPDYVPVLDFRKYSGEYLEEMHPDVIFFHNPYDEFNYVTSVDAQYYSRNLKKYTDKLIYIPYFVLGDTVSEGFSQTAAVYNADYVILQNKRIEFQFRKYYTGKDKDKFLSLGSPKIDKVLKSRREDFTLPVAWKNKIKNKKILLFNTTLGVYLLFKEKTLLKLRKVLQYMKGRNDVALWWRPHPLLKATLHSLHPELEDEYDSIVRSYLEEDWGIFDDSADLHRALAYSDAYYGDGSSVLWVYQETRKPAMLQECSNRSWTVPLLFCFDFDEKGYVWYKPLAMNRLYRGNLLTGEITYTDFKSKLWSSASTLRWDFTQLCCCNNHIILIPDNDTCLWDYDENADKWKKVCIDEESPWYEWIFMGSVTYQGKVIMYGNNGIAVYNPETAKIEYKCKVLSVDGKVYSLPERQVHYGVVCSDRLWLPTLHEGIILSLDLRTWHLQKHIVEPTNVLWTYLAAEGHNLWMLSNNTLVVSFNLKTNKKTEYRIEPYRNGGEIFYVSISYTGARIVLMPSVDNCYAKQIVILNPVTSETNFVTCEHEDGQSGVDFAVQKKDGTVVGHYGNNHILIIVDPMGNVSKSKLLWDETHMKKWERGYTLSGKMHTIHEWEGAELGEFLDNVVLTGSELVSHVTEYGRDIYRWTIGVT